MTTRTFPSIKPNTMSWELIANSQQFVALSGAIQTAQRPGQRWTVQLEYAALVAADRAVLQAFVVQVLGQADNFTLSPADYDPQGAFGGTPRVAGAGQTGNSLSIDGCTLAFADAQNLVTRDMTFERSWNGTFSPVNDFTLAALGLAVGDTISVSAEVRSQTGADQVDLTLRFHDSAGQTISDVQPSATSATYTRVASANIQIPAGTAEIRIFGSNNTNTETASIRRIMLNRGSTALPFSFQRWVHAGDFFQVGNELKMATQDASPDSTGAITLSFVPELRAAPANNTVLIMGPSATGVFRFVQPRIGWSSRAPFISSMTLECVEDITA